MASTALRQQVPASRVLVVGPRGRTRDLVTLVLGGLQYGVASEPAGERALNRLALEPFQLVLLDLSGDYAAGIAFARRLSQSPPPLPALPVVALGGTAEGIPEGAAASGIVAHLPAPVSLNRLLNKVHRLTRNSRAQRGAIAQPPTVDIDHLNGFIDGDPQLERELAVLFASSASDYLERMATAMDAPEEWRRAAHGLKGACANLGAQHAAKLAAAAEHGQPDAALLRTLYGAVDEVRLFFHRRGTA